MFWLFYKICLRSVVSFNRSRRELSTDVAEHRSTLKKFKNTHYPYFSFIPKKRYGIPQNGGLFLLCMLSSVKLCGDRAALKMFL